MHRVERRERWEGLFSPGALALTGVFFSVLLLSQRALEGRVAIFAAAALAAWFSGRRMSPLMTVVVMIGIVGANLLVPIGRKLAVWGPLVITEVALREGILKAVTFEALVFISKACLGPKLKLPGRFGSFFSAALRTYDRILAYKGRVRARTFMADIDAALVAVYAETGDTIAVAKTEYAQAKGKPKGDAWLLVAAAAGLASFMILSQYH